MNKFEMKRIVLFLGFIAGSLFCQAQFTAVLTKTDRGNKKVYEVKSDGTKYRYDFEEDGKQGVVIVNQETNQTAILFPEKKFIRYIETTSPFSGLMDPNQAFKQLGKTYTEKNAGSEKINGLDAEKIEIYADDSKIITGWYSNDLKFLLKMIHHTRENTFVELTNIEHKKVDPNVFSIPADYVEVDDQMRIKIPEPPAPTSWRQINTKLPVSGEFSRGDKIVFNVQENEYLYFTLKNETSEPAKIIRIPMRNGKNLPEKEQMPIGYRTKRLYANETEKFGSYFTPGDDLIIEVHEGKMQIEISSEKQ